MHVPPCLVYIRRRVQEQSSLSSSSASVAEVKESMSPPSPGVSTVQLSDCMEELVRITLTSFLDGTLGVDLPFSKDYCSRLLEEVGHSLRLDHCLESENGCSTSGGVPQYPLYKRLAWALGQSTSSGSFIKVSDSMMGIQEVELVRKKENEWKDVIVHTGSELANMLKAVNFELHVQEPFFSQLRAGLKTVEGRCAVGNYNRIAPGALLLFNKSLVLPVQHVKWYESFSVMLQKEALSDVLPGLKTIEEGIQVYRKFYSEEKEKSNGVLAIYVSRPISQPSALVAKLLTGLHYEGIGRLLGMVHTLGTLPDALPPSCSTLILSFTSLHHPEVRGCSMTNGARALAKHAIRSSDGWWGTFCGNDSNKNKLALKILSTLLANCCWMNVYVIQPHGEIFEIRVAEGYGARWSTDGSKFIGFLDPYMEEGHMKGWKH